MPEVKVSIKNIEQLRLATKSVAEKDLPDRKLIQVAFLADIHPADVARLVQFDRSGTPIDIVISSPQAIFDFKLEKVNLTSGEVTDR